MFNIKKVSFNLHWIAILTVILAVVLLAACASGIVSLTPTPEQVGFPTATPGAQGLLPNGGLGAPKGPAFSLNVALSQGQPLLQAVTPLPQATGEPLTQEQID